MRYQYWQDPKLVWCWHLTGGGKVLAHGEGYADKPAVLRAIELARRSRPADGDVGQSRRYRLSFAALLAVGAAALQLWGAAAVLLPRWDGSQVTVDAAVVGTSSHGTGKNRIDYTTVRFDTPEGRTITTTMSNSAVDAGATAVRVRYDPADPKKATLASTLAPYSFAVTLFIGAGFFLWLARKSSLHDGRNHFM